MPTQHNAGAARAETGGINHASPIPKHFQLREILLELLDAEMTVDAAIPSERELGQRFGLSRMTVRQAVEALVGEGRLYRVPGRGTFVAPPKIVMPLQLTSFTDDMRTRGHTAGAVDLGHREIPATETLAEALQIDVGAPVLVLERLRTADGEPMAVERAHLPAQLAPGLIDQPLTDTSLYAVLQKRYSVVLDSGEQTIEAVTAGSLDAELLHVARGSPVLLLVRRSNAGGRPAEYLVSKYRADRYRLRVPLAVPARRPRSTLGGPR